MGWRRKLALWIDPTLNTTTETSPVVEAVEEVSVPVIELPNPDDYTDEELAAIVKGKIRYSRIYHDVDRLAFFLATDEERIAWNEYVEIEVNKFNNNPRLDSYDSVDVFPGWNRDGRQTPWSPPKKFPEWLAERKR